MSYWLGRLKAWLLYLLLFSLPFQTRLILRPGEMNGYWEYGTYSLYAVEIILWLIIILTTASSVILSPKGEGSLTSHIENTHGISRPAQAGLGMTWWAGALLVIGLVSAFLALSPSLSFYWLLHFIEGLAIFWIIKQSAVDWKKLSAAFVAGAVMQAGLAIWQFATQLVFASKWLGMAAQYPSILGTSVVEAAGGRFLRAYGSLPHPNILGVYLLIAIVLLFLLRLRVQKKSSIVLRPRRMRLGSTSMELLLHTFSLILVAGVFFSFSRAAWLGLFLTIIFSTYAMYKSNAKFLDREILRYFYTLPISVIVIFMVLGLTFWPLTRTRLMGGERLEAKSNIERLSGYQEAWQIIRNHPWLGVGPGNYTLAVYQADLQRRSIPDIDSVDIGNRSMPQPSWAYQPVHNVYLLALAELGIFEPLAFMALLFMSLRGVRLNVLPIVILAFLFLFDHFFWSLPFGIWLFWSIMGLNYARLNFSAPPRDI